MKVLLIDRLNIILILVSAILAYFFPLSLFILAYAILGPLHYFTEINWLHERQYYFQKKKYVWLVIGLIASSILVLPKLLFEYVNLNSDQQAFWTFVNSWSNAALFVSLVLAVSGLLAKKIWHWILASVIAISGAFLLNGSDVYTMLIGLFVPTIIHVYLFTIIFMIYGAKKSKSRMGYWAAAIGIIMPVFFVFLPVSSSLYQFIPSFKDIYLGNNFHVTPVIFAKYLGISEGKTFFFYEHMELRLMMFISFIYCYHYLNWFSKTTVIQWHKMLTIKRTLLIAIFWLICLILFYIDFRLGFLFSLFFSFLHVILEFPLNALSIKGVFSKS
jgi:hypothetical protein